MIVISFARRQLAVLSLVISLFFLILTKLLDRDVHESGLMQLTPMAPADLPAPTELISAAREVLQYKAMVLLLCRGEQTELMEALHRLEDAIDQIQPCAQRHQGPIIRSRDGSVYCVACRTDLVRAKDD